jgi:hypothetical protein
MNRIAHVFVIAMSLLLGFASSAFTAEAEKSDKEKAYYGTVVAIDANTKMVKLVTNDGVMVDIAAEGKAAKHLDKIPPNTLIDMNVEMRDGAAPLIKSWKMAQAQSPCRVFDGSMCAP